MTRPSTPDPASDPTSMPHRDSAAVSERPFGERDASLITIRRLAGSVEPIRRTLHARAGVARPGEADRAELLVLDAGEELTWPAAALDVATLGGRIVEWLVLSGEMRVDGEPLDAGDFLRHPMSGDGHRAEAITPSRVYVRFGVPVLDAVPSRAVSRVTEALWDGAAGGFQRRVLWLDDAEAVLLVRAPAGFAIPSHRHRVDEECLVLRGEISTGPVSLHEGDFQIAPAGGAHAVVGAVTDVLVYLRGDPHYDFIQEP